MWFTTNPIFCFKEESFFSQFWSHRVSLVPVGAVTVFKRLLTRCFDLLRSIGHHCPCTSYHSLNSLSQFCHCSILKNFTCKCVQWYDKINFLSNDTRIHRHVMWVFNRLALHMCAKPHIGVCITIRKCSNPNHNAIVGFNSNCNRVSCSTWGQIIACSHCRVWERKFFGDGSTTAALISFLSNALCDKFRGHVTSRQVAERERARTGIYQLYWKITRHSLTLAYLIFWDSTNFLIRIWYFNLCFRLGFGQWPYIKTGWTYIFN